MPNNVLKEKIKMCKAVPVLGTALLQKDRREVPTDTQRFAFLFYFVTVVYFFVIIFVFSG